MSYSSSDYQADTVKLARAFHLTYRRAQYLLARWYSGYNVGADEATTNIAVRASEFVADMEANGNAKLNTVLAVSDLKLPD